MEVVSQERGQHEKRGRRLTMRSEERSEERGTRLCGWGENELKTKNELKMKRKNIIFEGGREGERKGIVSHSNF